MTGLRSLLVNTASATARVPWFVYSLTEAKHLATELVSHGPRHLCSHSRVSAVGAEGPNNISKFTSPSINVTLGPES